jgi:pimeloyl-ACP methyl ester carboxylesterase
MKKMAYESREIAYKIVGKGKPVLFIHGALTDHTTTGKFVDEVTRNGFQVILFDLPAHGKSTYWTGSQKKLITTLKDLITHLGINEYYCIGHSLGANIASELAVSDKRITKVILLTPVISKAFSSVFFIKTFLECLLELDVSLVNIAKVAYLKNWFPEYSERAVKKRVEEFKRQRREAFWAGPLWSRGINVGKNTRELGNRCLIIAARFDAVAPLKYAEAVANNLEVVDSNHSSVKREHFGKGKKNLFVKFLN